eukprot:366564-Chlamydomonas_euryale.AAC.5
METDEEIARRLHEELNAIPTRRASRHTGETSKPTKPQQVIAAGGPCLFAPKPVRIGRGLEHA